MPLPWSTEHEKEDFKDTVKEAVREVVEELVEDEDLWRRYQRRLEYQAQLRRAKGIG